MPTPNPFELACEANHAYRRMRMNVKYYGAKLWWAQFWNLLIELLIAVGTSATVASIAIWHTDPGKLAFQLLAASAVVLSVAKPILRLSERVSRYSRIWAAYNGLHATCERVVRDMKLHQELRPQMQEMLVGALDSFASLQNEEDPNPSRWLLKKKQAQVEKELPLERLWWPEGCFPSSGEAVPEGRAESTATAHTPA